jgi:hypothetical protein
MGGSAGASSNKSKSSGSSSSEQEVWQPQGDALQNLWGQANDLFGQGGQYQGQFNNVAQNLSPFFNQVNQGAMGGYQDQLGGGAFGDTTDMRNMLMDNYRRQQSEGSQSGQMYQSIVGGEGNSYIDPMVDAMKQGSMENLDMLKSNARLDAADAGQPGWNRHAFENVKLGEQTGKNMIQNEMNMRAGGYDKDLALKMGIAARADQGTNQMNQNLRGMINDSNKSQQAGMQFGQNMQNLGMGSFAPWQQAQMAPWDPMNSYANIVGRPTVLSSSQGNQSGSSKGGGASASGGLFG